MVKLAGVEVNLLNKVLATEPDYGNAKTLSKAGLVIDSSSVKRLALLCKSTCEVSNHEARSANLSNDLIIDLVSVFFLVHPKRTIARIVDTRFFKRKSSPSSVASFRSDVVRRTVTIILP